ncbi:Rieske 2Fe-2S domain-containing protein [Kitasatospora sp. NPDC001574]
MPPFNRDLKPGAVSTVTLAGEGVAIYRTTTGAVRAVRSACPHLGAHLRQGQVSGENIGPTACLVRISRPSGGGFGAPTDTGPTVGPTASAGHPHGDFQDSGPGPA